jgi:hypothetical protein
MTRSTTFRRIGRPARKARCVDATLLHVFRLGRSLSWWQTDPPVEAVEDAFSWAVRH